MKTIYKNVIAFVFCAILVAPIQGQDPYHFKLGQEELAAIDVYDINQTIDGKYWIATNNGMYLYDGYTFTKFEHEATLSNSFFNVIKDHNDVIHFNNLNGQIFKIAGEKMELVHAIPDSLLSPYISFDFLKNNELVVRALRTYKIKDNKVEFLFKQKKNYNSSSKFSRDNDGNLLLPVTNDRLIKISEHGIEEIRIDNQSQQGELDQNNFDFVYQKEGIFINDTGHSLLKVMDSSKSHFRIKKIFSAIDPVSMIHLTDDKLWVANHRYGIRLYNHLSNQNLDEQRPKLLFKQHFISEVFEDAVGNTLMGTFGDGIIVLPKTGVEDMLTTRDFKISKITSNNAGGLYIGGFNGNVYNYNAHLLDTIYNHGTKLVETIYFMKNQKLIFISQERPLLINAESKEINNFNAGSVKDITQIDDDNYVIATNVGAYKLVINAAGVLEQLQLYSGRTYGVAYDDINKAYFIACSKGLLKVDSLLQQQFILHENDPLMVNDIKFTKFGLLAGSKKHGLMIIANDVATAIADRSNELLSNAVEQFKVYNDQIFIATDKGFQLFNQDEGIMNTLTISDGLKSTKIRDFEIDENYLWLLHQHGLQRIEVSKLLSQKITYNSKIDNIQCRVNDEVYKNDVKRLKFDQNKIEFEVRAPSLERQEDITYWYRLVGLDTTWNVNKYLQNSIGYLSLPAGEYEFEVVLKYKNKEQDRRSVQFSIAKPIWQRWWFIVFILLVFSTITYWFYSVRLKRLKRKSDQIIELNESKLTAIQAQMNPHFIFNALNSIQEFIVLNEKKQATKYLGMFADLMRIYLRQGKTKTISVGEEIEALKLYLELEKMRFEESLTYEIIIEDKVIENTLSIPSLIIQPYVENAIKHGLLHKESDRKLTVGISYDSYHQSLLCVIEDNGVGRIKSREINQMRNPNHKSFASGATKRRLELLNTSGKRATGEQIEDLYGENALAIGTKVTLTIPVELGNS
jgi:ligand-binding sensor domain-containing protein